MESTKQGQLGEQVVPVLSKDYSALSTCEYDQQYVAAR